MAFTFKTVIRLMLFAPFLLSCYARSIEMAIVLFIFIYIFEDAFTRVAIQEEETDRIIKQRERAALFDKKIELENILMEKEEKDSMRLGR